MIVFNENKYELFFSNKFPPFVALYYCDGLFFDEFEKLCGIRYKILSIIRHGWQRKYALMEDIDKLGAHFDSKMKEPDWAQELLFAYEEESEKLKNTLEHISKNEYEKLADHEIVNDIYRVRKESSFVDAMSNMLHMFGAVVGHKFFKSLHQYSKDKDLINKNFIFYTQPIKEGRLAKIIMNDLEGKFSLSDEDTNFSNILRLGAFVKDDVCELLDTRKILMKNLFQEISNRMRCNIEDLEYLQTTEIEHFLLNKENPSSLISERKDVTVLHYEEEKLNVLEGEKAENFLKSGEFEEIKIDSNVRELTGQTASLGKVVGQVIVAKDSYEANLKMKEGYILVAPYTRVEYLPAMKKAAAIVTETGSITAHAAVVSREMGIPCILDVKEVIKILKDGDMVEVDADNGIIRRM